jgi:hypothetical protein
LGETPGVVGCAPFDAHGTLSGAEGFNVTARGASIRLPIFAQWLNFDVAFIPSCEGRKKMV